MDKYVIPNHLTTVLACGVIKCADKRETEELASTVTPMS